MPHLHDVALRDIYSAIAEKDISPYNSQYQLGLSNFLGPPESPYLHLSQSVWSGPITVPNILYGLSIKIKKNTFYIRLEDFDKVVDAYVSLNKDPQAYMSTEVDPI